MPKSTQPSSIYCLHTLPGLEPVAWLEVRRHFPAAEFISYVYAQDEFAGVVFRLAEAPEKLFRLRTVTSLLAVALWQPRVSRGVRDLREISEKLAKSGEIGRLFKAMGRLQRKHLHSYQVVGRMYGKHEYDLRDWSLMVRRTIAGVHPDWQGTTTNPDVEVWATLFGSQALVGIRLPFSAPPAGPYPPALAAALVLLTEPAAGEAFLDPVSADGGSVLAERLADGADVAIWGARDGIARRLQRPDPAIKQLRWEQSRLPLDSASVDKMAAILPADPQAIQQYPAILSEIARLLRPDGQAVVYSEEYDLLRARLREQGDLHIAHGYSVRGGAKWGRIYVLQHGSAAHQDPPGEEQPAARRQR